MAIESNSTKIFDAYNGRFGEMFHVVHFTCTNGKASNDSGIIVRRWQLEKFAVSHASRSLAGHGMELDIATLPLHCGVNLAENKQISFTTVTFSEDLSQ